MRLLILSAACLLLAACRADERREPPPAADFLEVRPAALRLPAGATAQLAVQANDASGRPVGGARFSFHVADGQLARVTPRGLVTAMGRTGRTEVIVTSGDLRQVVPLDVVAGPPARIEPLLATFDVVAGAGPLRTEVRVVDAVGLPVPEVEVRFETGPADGSAEPASVATGTDGIAATDWALPAEAGPHTLTVTAGGLAPVRLVVVVTP